MCYEKLFSTIVLHYWFKTHVTRFWNEFVIVFSKYEFGFQSTIPKKIVSDT